MIGSGLPCGPRAARYTHLTMIPEAAQKTWCGSGLSVISP
jgi:hypothetical protein